MTVAVREIVQSEDSETFDVTVENGGTHAAMVTGGVVEVTIE